jgi:perosamine synthetase
MKNSTIFTSLSPNAEIDDVLLAAKLLFMPWKWQKGSSLNKLQHEFQKIIPVENVFFFESGRTCLYLLLRALDIKENDEVLLQAYTCVAVPEPILWVKAKPVYVDCDEESLGMSPVDLEQKITPKSKVLIIQHTFGNPAGEMEKLLKIAKKHHLFVIEDCAHALGSSYKDQKTGTFADASFFSFGRDKVISSVFGGTLTVKNSELASKIAIFHEKCEPISKRWIFQQLLHPILTGIAKASYDIYLGKIILALSKRLRLISKAVYPEERKGLKPPFLLHQLPNALACLAVHQLQKLDPFNTHRAKIAQFYEQNLDGLSIRLPKKTRASKPAWLRYTIQTEKAAELLKAAAREKIYLGDWYTTSIAPKGVDYEKIRYNPKSCPVAEKLARQSVNLPTDIHINKTKALRIIHFLKSFYGGKTTSK